MKSLVNSLFPKKLWTRPTIVFGGGLFFKFILSHTIKYFYIFFTFSIEFANFISVFYCEIFRKIKLKPLKIQTKLKKKRIRN